MTTATIHPFEEAGLGLAPFRFTGMSENVINHGNGHMQAGGTCDYCYNGIRYEYWIASADGKRFKVGCDCVLKLERADNRLVTAVQRAKAQHAKAKREAARQAKWEAGRPAREAAARERAAREAERLAAEQAANAERIERQGWLIDVLNRQPGDFCASLAADLERREIASLSDRCVVILRDIYAKAIGGRRGSKAYAAAEAEFDAKAGL